MGRGKRSVRSLAVVSRGEYMPAAPVSFSPIRSPCLALPARQNIGTVETEPARYEVLRVRTARH